MDANEFYEQVQNYVKHADGDANNPAASQVIKITGFGEADTSSHPYEVSTAVVEQCDNDLLGLADTDEFAYLEEEKPAEEPNAEEQSPSDTDVLGLDDFEFSDFQTEDTAPTQAASVVAQQEVSAPVQATVPAQATTQAATQVASANDEILGYKHIKSVAVQLSQAMHVYRFEDDCLDFLRFIGYEVTGDDLVSTWVGIEPAREWDYYSAVRATLNYRYQVNVSNYVIDKYLKGCEDAALVNALMVSKYMLPDADADQIAVSYNKPWYNSDLILRFARNTKLLDALLLYMQNCEVSFDLAEKYDAISDEAFVSFLLLSSAGKFDQRSFDRMLKSGLDITAITANILEGKVSTEFESLKGRQDYEEVLATVYGLEDQGCSVPSEFLDRYKDYVGLCTILRLYAVKLFDPSLADDLFLQHKNDCLLKLIADDSGTLERLQVLVSNYHDLELARILLDMESFGLDTFKFVESLQLDRDSKIGEALQCTAYKIVQSYYGYCQSGSSEYSSAEAGIDQSTYKQLLYLLSATRNEHLLAAFSEISVSGSIATIMCRAILHAIGCNSQVDSVGRSLVIIREDEKIYTSLDYVFLTDRLDSYMNPVSVKLLPDSCGLFLSYVQEPITDFSFTFEMDAPTSLATWADFGISSSAESFKMVDPISHANFLECLTQAKSSGVALHRESLIKILNMTEQEYAMLDVAFGVILRKMPEALGLLGCANLKFALRILARNYTKDKGEQLCFFLQMVFSVSKFRQKFNNKVQLHDVTNSDKIKLLGLLPISGEVLLEDFFSGFDGILASAIRSNSITLFNEGGYLALSLS